MEVTKNKLLTFRTNNEEYLFSGYTGLLVNCNAELKQALEEPASIEDEKIKKYIFGEASKCKRQPILSPSETTLQHLSVFATNRCNLKCSYCYERVNNVINSTNMSLDTFKAGIEFFRSQFKIEKPVNIHFFGGEPLMNMKLIREAVDYLKGVEKDNDIHFTYSLTTNGTILNHHNILDFLLKNNFSTMVSIDGFKENHDYYRPYVNGKGSYDKVIKNIQLLSQYQKVVARITLNDMDTDIVKLYEELKENGVWEILVIIVSKKDLLAGQWQETISPLKKRINELENYFLKNIKQKKIVRYRDLLKYLKIIHNGFNGKEKMYPCAAGYSSFSLAANGDIYLCHRFNNIDSMKLGNIKEGIILERRREFLESHHLSIRHGECKTCWVGPICGGTCYHTTYSLTCDTHTINRLHCAYTEELVKSALNIYVSLTSEERNFLENLD